MYNLQLSAMEAIN